MMGWQSHQLDHMQIICTSPQTDKCASTSPLGFLQAGCPSCSRPTNSVKALKTQYIREKVDTSSLTVPATDFSMFMSAKSGCTRQRHDGLRVDVYTRIYGPMMSVSVTLTCRHRHPCQTDADAAPVDVIRPWFQPSS